MRIWGLLLITAALGQAAHDPEALFEAARTGDRARVLQLLDSGIDVNVATRYGVTALGFAAGAGHLDVVRLLVERRANVNVADSFYGSRPVDFARRGGHKAVIDFLLPLTETRKPADSATRINLNASQLRAFEGRYQSAASGAEIVVAVTDRGLTLAAEGQPTLQLHAIEERRFVAEGAADMTLTFSGRGGIIERLVLTRGTSNLRYEREGYADATSPAPAPNAARTPAPASVPPAPSTSRAPGGSTRRAAAPWPAFRGANAAGSADGQGAVSEWDVATGKNILWKTPIAGLAVSSPIIWGDRVFVVGAASDQDTTFRTGLYGDVKPVDDLSRHTFRVYALDRRSGKIVWEREVFSGAPQTKRHTKSSQANSTPVTDGRHIVAVFGSIGTMVCLDMDGSPLWKKDLGALNSGWFLDPAYQWGHASSPVIYKSSVIVQADQARGSFLAAFNLADGRELWRTERAGEISTWGTPTILSGKNGDEIVTNGTKVRGYDPATGKLLWTLAPNSEIAIGTPVVRGDVVYVTAGYPPVRPVYAIRAGARGDISLAPGQSSNAAIVWSHDRDGTYISSPIVYRDVLYTLNNNGIFTAYDATTGERLYRARVGGGGAFSASPIAADGKIYIASEDGDVFVVQAGREYLELAKHTMGEVIMASPAISDGVLVIRTLGHVWGIGARD